MARAAPVSLTITLALAALGCGGDDSTATRPVAPADAAPAAAAPPADAGPPAPPTEPEPDDEIAEFSTAADDDFHLDEPALSRPLPAAPTEPERRLDITLRSTPAGARVQVDGEPVGTTPAYWAGEASGRPREFTFVLPGYEMARYRFVPTQSGVVHATLDELVGPVPADAGPGDDRERRAP